MSHSRDPLAELTPQVLANCRRADAQVAGRFSLCGLLLRLRNLYKWEQGLPPWREEESAVMLDWVQQREDLWLEAQEEELQPLSLEGVEYDPFDAEGVNAILEPQGLVYGAGRAGGLVPVFFLGRLASREQIDGLTVRRLGEEVGRDILFIAGLRQGGEIYLRSSPLLYLLWDKLADPRPSQRRFLEFGCAGYGVDLDDLLARPSLEALAPLLEGELQAVLWHELGEAGPADLARKLLLKVIEEHPGSELEHFTRGVKDLLADTGPQGRLARIIGRQAQGQLGFYPTWLAGFPRLLFPELDGAVLEFLDRGNWGAVEAARELGWNKARQALAGLEEILAQAQGEEARRKAHDQVIAPLTACARRALEDEE